MDAVYVNAGPARSGIAGLLFDFVRRCYQLEVGIYRTNTVPFCNIIAASKPNELHLSS